MKYIGTGGIYAALSPTSAQTVIEVCRAAKRSGTIVSYDLNYRPSLWKSIGGQARAIISTDVMVTSFRVPRIGGRTIHTRRRMPADRPTMEVIQYSSSLLKAKLTNLTKAKFSTRNRTYWL